MKILRALAVCAACSAIALAPSTARAQGKTAGAPDDEASTRFKAGVAFYKDGDFTAALVEFKRAYELAPNYRVLFNLGQTSRELKDYASALSAFERYLSEGGKEIDAAKRKKIQEWVDELKTKVARVTFETNVEGAEILVDDVSVGTTPLTAPVLVNTGRRRFSATLSGYTPVQRGMEVAGSDETTVKLELVKIARDNPIDPPPPPPPPPEPKPMPIAPWAVLGVTGAAAIATSVTGGLAIASRGDLDTALAAYPGDKQAIEDAQSKTQTLALTADIMGGVTIAGAATTVVLFVVMGAFGDDGTAKPDEAAPEGATDAEKTSLRISPIPISSSGLGIHGTF